MIMMNTKTNMRKKIDRSKYEEMIRYLIDCQGRMIAYAEDKYKKKKLRPDLKITLSRTGGLSKCYGHGLIHYSVRHYTSHYDRPGVRTFYEYKHINEDPVIGQVEGNWKVQIAALVAHEYAHFLDDNLSWPHIKVPASFNAYKPRTPRENRGHGKSWQFIYADLREKFVNNIATRCGPKTA